MLCYLIVFSGPKCENHVREFVSSVRFVNMPVSSLRCQEPLEKSTRLLEALL